MIKTQTQIFFFYCKPRVSPSVSRCLSNITLPLCFPGSEMAQNQGSSGYKLTLYTEELLGMLSNKSK